VTVSFSNNVMHHGVFTDLQLGIKKVEWCSLHARLNIFRTPVTLWDILSKLIIISVLYVCRLYL